MSTELLPGFEAASVLLSVRPAYAKLIASGSKTVELRRRFPDLPAGSTLIVYATQPVAAIVALARLASITSLSLPTLWRRFGAAAAVTKQTFDVYFSECERGLAIELAGVTSFARPMRLADLRGIWPAFSPPQSYRYVPDGVLKKLRSRSQSPNVDVRSWPTTAARR